MAERWQQWMPHDIDSWQGSANVQALSDLAYRAVHNLILDMWKQADCALPDDDRELAKRSRVAARWNECRDEVREYFMDRTDNGKITHRVTLKKWNEAREVYEKRQSAAKKTNESRSAHGDRNGDRDAQPTVTERTPSRSADTGTSTGTETSTKKENQEPLALTSPEVRAGVVSIPLTGKKVHIVTEQDVAMYQEAYPSIDVIANLRKIPPWIDSKPERRSASVNGSKQRIVKWLTKAQDEAVSKAPPGGSNGTHRISAAQQREDESRANIDAAGAWLIEQYHGAGQVVLPEPGHHRGDEQGVADGLGGNRGQVRSESLRDGDREHLPAHGMVPAPGGYRV